MTTLRYIILAWSVACLVTGLYFAGLVAALTAAWLHKYERNAQ